MHYTQTYTHILSHIIILYLYTNRKTYKKKVILQIDKLYVFENSCIVIYIYIYIYIYTYIYLYLSTIFSQLFRVKVVEIRKKCYISIQNWWTIPLNKCYSSSEWLGGRSFWPDAVYRRRRVKRASGRITTWTILENWTKGIKIISRILLLNKALRTGICSYTILLSYPTASGQARIFPWVIHYVWRTGRG